ncbi:uncharacterized protein LOC144118723 [Amblyomma americanum]
MLSTSKNRRPQQPTHSRNWEGAETNHHRSEVSCGPDAQKPPPEPCPCGVRHDTRIRSETDLGTDVTPMPSSTRTLFATPMPPRPSFIRAGPTMTPRFPGFAPPLRAPASGLKHGSKMYLMREGGEDEHVSSGVPWLQNFGIGVLVATLLAAVLTLALTADRPAGAVVGGTSPLPLQAGKMAESVSKVAAAVQPMNTLSKIRHKVTRRSLAWMNVTSSLPPVAMKLTHPRFQRHIKNRTRRPHHRCGPRFYTYCARPRHEAYYSARSRTCSWTPSDRASLCNRGTNRFPNLGTCLASCAQGAPRDRCFESAVFTDCSRQDVLEEWWWFDGIGCVQWNFPRGSCPSHGSSTFRSREDCTRNCAPRQRQRGRDDPASDVQQRSHCHAPIKAACSMRQMRFPYFADMTAKGSARCVRASKSTLLARRCLVGSNRFDSLSACKSGCGERRQRRGKSATNPI